MALASGKPCTLNIYVVRGKRILKPNYLQRFSLVSDIILLSTEEFST